MNRGLGRLLVAAVFVGGLVVLSPPQPADAHTAVDYYNTFYENSVPYSFTAGFFGGGVGATAYRNRVGAGFAAWNALEPVAYVAVNNGAVSADYNPRGCPASPLTNGIHSRSNSSFPEFNHDAQTHYFALTFWCVYTDNGRRMYSAQIVYNSSDPQYTGTSTTPTGQVDMWALSSHEAGHFSGSVRLNKGHWWESDNAGSSTVASCAEDGTRETMCPNLYVGGSPGGGTVQRDLGTHDAQTFTAAQS